MFRFSREFAVNDCSEDKTTFDPASVSEMPPTEPNELYGVQTRIAYIPNLETLDYSTSEPNTECIRRTFITWFSGSSGLINRCSAASKLRAETIER
jgi:hypothetical protein